MSQIRLYMDEDSTSRSLSCRAFKWHRHIRRTPCSQVLSQF